MTKIDVVVWQKKFVIVVKKQGLHAIILLMTIITIFSIRMMS